MLAPGSFTRFSTAKNSNGQHRFKWLTPRSTIGL
jgi:hypothetical protein